MDLLVEQRFTLTISEQEMQTFRSALEIAQRAKIPKEMKNKFAQLELGLDLIQGDPSQR